MRRCASHEARKALRKPNLRNSPHDFSANANLLTTSHSVSLIYSDPTLYVLPEEKRCSKIPSGCFFRCDSSWVRQTGAYAQFGQVARKTEFGRMIIRASKKCCKGLSWKQI